MPLYFGSQGNCVKIITETHTIQEAKACQTFLY